MDDQFPFAVTPTVSPQRPQPCVPDGSSDDEFVLVSPTPCTKKPFDPNTASDASLDLQAPTTARDAVDGGNSFPSAETASAAVEVMKKVDKKLDQTDLESFPQVKSQKHQRWGSIAKEELVWYRSFPALVVPPALHLTVNSDIIIPTHDGVMTYGPSAKGVTPSKKRYVILQYLPLCCSSHAKPECPFEKVAGHKVENVLPYNTRMGKKKRQGGEDGEFGPEGVWADTEHHFKTLKQLRKEGRNLTSENWTVAMNYAQKYLDRALELEAETAEADRLEKIVEEEERRLQKEGKDKEDEMRRREGVDGGVEVEAQEENGVAEAAPPTSVPLVESKNLKLSAGDGILFSDPTRIAGTLAARKTAIILEIRTKAEARDWGVGRLVLDRNQIIGDDWAVRKYVKNKKTGKTKLDHRWNIVSRYRLIPGKLEGVHVGEDKLMNALVSDLKKDMRDQGYGDQLREAGRDEQSSSDGDDADQSGDESEAEAEAAIPTAQQSKTPVRSSDVGRREDEDSDGDAIAASLTTRRVAPREASDEGGGSQVVRPAVAAIDEGGGAAKKEENAAEPTHDDDGEGESRGKIMSGGGPQEVGGQREPKKRRLSKLDNDEEVEPKNRKSAKLGDVKVKPGKRKLSKSDGEKDEPTKRKSGKQDDDEPMKRGCPMENKSEKAQTKGKRPASKILSKKGKDKPKQRRFSKEKPSEKPKAKEKSPASKAAVDKGDVQQRKRKNGGDEKVPSKKDKCEGVAETLQRKGKHGEAGAKPKVAGYSIPKKKPPQGEGQDDGVRSHHGVPGARITEFAPSSTSAAAGPGGGDEKRR